MPLATEVAFGDALEIGRIDDGTYLRRVGLKIVGDTPETDGQAYPVGGVFVTTIDDADPNALLGYGTWTKLGVSLGTMHFYERTA